jgi:translation initiation factor 2 beta subunit (eIF-2beta)/eIF-5
MEKLPEYVVRVNAGQKVQPKTISIRGQDDAFDRYKMRQLFVQIVGKGKMIRTVLLNVDEVADNLKTEPSYIGAYFAYDLGAQPKYDKTKPERERASISGEQDSAALSRLLNKFIREVILCPGCGLPETTLSLDKGKEEVGVKCSGCSYSGALKVDNSKFLKFIFRNPPQVVQTASRGQAAQAEKKAEPKAKPAASAKGSAKKPAKREAAADDGDDENWSMSTDPAAVKLRQAELLPTQAVKELVGVAASNVDTAALTASLHAFAAKPVAEFVAEAKRLQATHSLDKRQTAAVVFDSLFNAQNIALKDTVKTAKAHLEPFLADESSEKVALDRLVALSADKPDLVKKLSAIVKQFYDHELVSEEAIIAWHELAPADAAGKAARASLQQMVDWLKQAEEEEEEGEEEDEE